MGIDFIRRTAKSFEKAWTGGKEQLARVDLFTRHPECQNRTVIADLRKGTGADVGDRLSAHVENSGLTLYRELQPVARAEKPPAELISAITDNGGYAIAEVTRRNPISETIDICVIR